MGTRENGSSTAIPPTPVPGHRSGRLPFLLVLGAITLIASGGVAYVLNPSWGGGAGASTRDAGRIPTTRGRPVPAIAPNRLVIPRLHASATVVEVGTHDRELDIPPDPHVVGWWNGGARPGAHSGTAVLAGHVDFHGVEGTLAPIGSLDPGDRLVVIGRHRGHPARLPFRVTGVRTYHKTTLPYRQIFAQGSVGRLAIVTCGGPFDPATGNYLDNIVVFAAPA